MQRDFMSDKEYADIMESRYINWLTNRNLDWCHTPHTYWMDFHNVKRISEAPYEYDFLVKGKGVELKSLAGGYSTAVIEKWSDDYRHREPGWRKSTRFNKLHWIIIENRSNGLWFLYDAGVLLEAIDSYPETLLTRAHNNCRDDSGWIAKFNWYDKDFGYKCTINPDMI